MSNFKKILADLLKEKKSIIDCKNRVIRRKKMIAKLKDPAL